MKIYLHKGYHINVESYENDGDYTATNSYVTQSKEEAEFLTDCVLLCQSQNRNPKHIGNMCSTGFYEGQKSAVIEVLNKHKDYILSNSVYSGVWDVINYEDDEALIEYFQLFVNNLLGYSDDYVFRVTRRVEVDYIEEDIYAEEVFKWGN